MGHLVIEKLLKALYAKQNKGAPYAPRIHDLYYLANDVMKLKLTERQSNLLDEITQFNMNGRYDDYRKSFHELCTEEYTNLQVKNIEGYDHG